MAALVPTTTLSAWPPGALGESPLRIGVPCGTTAERGKGRARLARLTPSTFTDLDGCAALDPTQGQVYRRYFSRFHPPLPRIRHPAFIFPGPALRAPQAAGGLDLCRDGLMLKGERGSADPRRSAESFSSIQVNNRLRAGETPGAKSPVESQ
jgi:hypothetical protein